MFDLYTLPVEFTAKSTHRDGFYTLHLCGQPTDISCQADNAVAAMPKLVKEFIERIASRD